MFVMWASTNFIKSKLEAGHSGAHTSNFSTHLGGKSRWISVNLRPAWSTERVPEQPGLYRETLSQERAVGVEGGERRKKKRREDESQK